MGGDNDRGETRAGTAGTVPKPAGASASVPPDAPVVEASTLFGPHRQVVIGHNGCRYVLRITRHGKLILNK
jgi:hemin uptake protein HemP